MFKFDLKKIKYLKKITQANHRAVLTVVFVGMVLVLGVGGVFALNGFFGGGAAVPEDTFSRGLVGYWSFDEGKGNIAYDASGNGNNGTLVNGPEWTDGKNGGALQFDGKDDYADLGNQPSSQISTGSIQAWIKTSNAGSSFRGIVTKQNAYGFFLKDNEFGLWDWGAMAWRGSGYYPNDNKWHFISCNFQSGVANGTLCYVDGLLKLTTTITISNQIIGLRIANGGTAGGGDLQNFNGLIDDVSIYNRVLTEAEVKYHYSHGGPVGYWKFDEGSGATARDSSGNNNDGAISGATWADGKYGQALSFDGVDDYVDAGASSIFQFGANDFTLATWIKISSNPDINEAFIQKRTSTSLGYEVGISPSMQIYGSAASSFGGSSNKILELNTWYYVSVVKSAGTTSLYIDGKLDRGAANIISASSDEKLYFAKDIRNNRFGNYILDEAKIYNYARGADEIRLDYQAGMATHLGSSGKTCSEDPASCMDKGLVGYWDMDESGGLALKDKTGNGNNGVIMNGAKRVTGKRGSALRFDGIDDNVRIDNSPTKIYSDVYSYSFWMKTGAPCPTTQCSMIDTGQSWNNEPGVYLNNGSKIRVVWGNTTIQYSNNPILLNSWNHIIVVAKSGQFSKIYINGVLDSQVTTTTAWSDASAYDIYFGIRHYAGQWPFKGEMDDIRIYNRELSAEEVRYHYNEGGPVGYWKFDEGSGVKAADFSGVNNDGVLGDGTCQPGAGACPLWGNGRFNSALSFDGINDYLNTNFGYTSLSKTITFWAKSNVVADTEAIPFGLQNPVNSGRFYIGYGGDGNLGIGLGGSPWANESGGYKLDTNWHYYAITWDGGTIKLYVDFVLRGQKSGSTSASGNFFIGANHYGSDFNSPFSGEIDDVRIYNYLRTDEQIKQDYQAGVANYFGPSGKTCSEDPVSCMDKGLVGYWDMDEGGGSIAKDLSGNGNNCNLMGGARWVSGKNGSSVEYDGNDDYGSCGNGSSVNLTDEISIEFWIKAGQQNRDVAIIKKGVADPKYDNYLMYIWGSGGTASFYVGNGTTSVFRSIGSITDNKWHHLIGTFTTTEMRFYLDGVQVGSPVATGWQPYQTAQPLQVGSGWVKNFKGILDDVRIYNRALSVEEVRYHYNQGAPMAQWDMDEGAGSVLNDSSRNHNRGTIYGASWTPGKYGGALSFDGANDYVSTNMADFYPFTSCSWVKWTGDGTNNDHAIGSFNSSNNGWGFKIYPANNIRVFAYGNDRTSLDTPIRPGEWTNVCLVFNGSEISLFVNGNRRGSVGGITPTTGGNILIGAIPKYNGVSNFAGIIDDVRIYNYARTADQIKMDYQQGLATHLK